MFPVLAKFHHELTFMKVMEKKANSTLQNSLFAECWICLFCHHIHECYFMMRLCKNSKHLSLFTEKIIQIFLKKIEFFEILLFMLISYELELRWRISNTFFMIANDTHI